MVYRHPTLIYIIKPRRMRMSIKHRRQEALRKCKVRKVSKTKSAKKPLDFVHYPKSKEPSLNPLPVGFLSCVAVMYPSSSVSPLLALSPSSTVGSAL